MKKSALTAAHMTHELERRANPEQAALLQRFFKTGPGEYGEGDRFYGMKVPQIRALVKLYRDAPLTEVLKLLRSPMHEARLLALLLMVDTYRRSRDDIRGEIYDLYLGNTRHINNWDLVDLSAPHIVGQHLEKTDRAILKKLAASNSLWERRISVLAPFWFIRQNDFDDALRIAALLLDDHQDLIHKAVGWMLREIGKRNLSAEEKFLRRHYRTMPRTMLRYAIERFPEPHRQAYLKGTI